MFYLFIVAVVNARVVKFAAIFGAAMPSWFFTATRMRFLGDENGELTY